MSYIPKKIKMPFGDGPMPFEYMGITPTQHYIMFSVTFFVLVFNIFISRLTAITTRGAPERREKDGPAELLIVLGSGGHTTEMLGMLRSVPDLQKDYNRTYIVSSGDSFSASKANELEKDLGANENYNIHTVRRARRVHQPIMTAPVTSLLCLRDCAGVLRGSPPDLILTNGPGTGVCVIFASVLLRFFWLGKGKEMRTTFIESWARVRTLSLSGKILIYFVDRFVVQWQSLVRILGKDSVEYRGPLVT